MTADPRDHTAAPPADQTVVPPAADTVGPCPPMERLELLTAKKLGPDDQAAVAAHLAGCPTCRQAAAVLTHGLPTGTWQAPPTVAEPDRPPALPAGLRDHPRYKVFGLLGRGGMGAVYKAEHRLLGRPAVLKLIRPEKVSNPAVVQRFEKEAKLAARLAHPHVVGVYEAEVVAGCPVLVLEYVDGVTLAELVAERGLLPVAEACELIRQAAVGLEYIHQQGLVHRDVKPHNLLVSRAGQVKVLDLGLATLKGDPAVPVPDMTGEHQFVGTVDYASPEQWESSRAVDIRADVYSLGCTLYYLLAGESPFPHKKYTTLMQQMWAHSQAPLPPVRELRPDVPEEVAAVLAKMLAKNRDDRFATPAGVAAALAPFAAGCDLAEFVRTARRTTTTSRTDYSQFSPAVRPPRPWRRWAVGAAVAAALGLLAVPWVMPRPAAAVVVAPAPDAPPPAVPGFAGPPLQVGVLHSLTGTMAVSERAVVDATLLAIDDLNAAGGVLGRKVEAVVEDGESDAATFAAKADKLIATDQVAAVFGCWTSASRKTVREVVERHDHLLVYPVQYEGLEQSPNVVYLGAAPNQQILPAVRWCVTDLKKKRLFLVGSDYVFPRTANAIIRDAAAELGAEVVGEEYLPLGTADAGGLVAKLVAVRPDVVLNTINGDSNVAFFRALRAAGVTPDAVPTVSFSLSEEELTAIGPKQTVGDYAAATYFQAVDRPANREFVAKFRAKYGPRRVVSDAMEAAYTGVHLWAKAAAAGDAGPAAVRAAVRGQGFDGPGGPVRIDPDTRHASKTFRVGKITPDGGFRVVYESAGPIAPIPYPSSRAKPAWDAFLREMQAGWGGRWANPAR